MAVIKEITDAPADPTTPYSMEIGDRFKGSIDPQGDDDFVRVSLEAGVGYQFDIRRTNPEGSKPKTLAMNFYDEDGERDRDILATQNSFSLTRADRVYDFVAPETGDYFINFRANNFKTKGQYKVDFSQDSAEGATDAPADTSTPAVIEVGSGVSGTIEVAGDSDWFAVTLKPRKTYSIDLEYETDIELDLAIYDENGNLVNDASTRGRVSEPFVYFSVPEKTTYFIAASGDLDTDIGDYRVRVMEVQLSSFRSVNDDRIFGGKQGQDISGNMGDDTIRGAQGRDSLHGDEGRDLLIGGSQDDSLRGGDGHDTLKGGTGDDLIDGGAGRNRLTGGEGSDVFRFLEPKGRNVVTDFDATEDRIGFRGFKSTSDAAAFLEEYADVVDGDTVFSFDTGLTVILKGVTDLESLSDVII